MKQCKYCLTKYADDEKSCPACGANDASHVCNNCDTVFDTAFCPNCGTEANDQGNVCPVCGKRYFSAACPSCGYTATGNSDKILQQTLSSIKFVRVNENPSAPPPPPPPPPKPEPPEPEKPKVGCLTIFLWVFFFPFMLMYKVWKSRRLPIVVKIIIIGFISTCVIINIYGIGMGFHTTTPVSAPPAVTAPANTEEPAS